MATATAPISYSYGHVQMVEYNGQIMSFPKVSVNGRMRYDDTNRSIIGMDLTFRVSCVFVGQAGGDPAKTTSENFRAQLHSFLKLISEPQKKFRWYEGPKVDPAAIVPGDNRLYIISPAPSTVEQTFTDDTTHIDKAWGPRPRVVDVQEITAQRSAKIEWQLDAFVTVTTDTFSTYTANTDILNYWQEYNYEFDRNFVCTRTVSGRYQLRTPLNAPEHFLSNAAFMPGLPKYFYRESINHHTSKDGTEVTFIVRDKEVFRTLPQPLTDGFATFRFDQQSANCQKTLSCSFTAPTDVKKAAIFQFIWCLIRFYFPNAKYYSDLNEDIDKNFGDYIMSISVQDHAFENRVDCTVTAKTFVGSMLETTSDGAPITPVDIFKEIEGMGPERASLVGDGIDPLWAMNPGRATSRGWLGTATGLGAAQPTTTIIPSSTGVTITTPVDTASPPAGETNPPGPEQANANKRADASGGDTATDSVLSSAQLKFPYLSFIESWHYVLVRGLALLKSSSPTGTDIVQRPTNPTLKILQIGSARRIGKMPDVPEPALCDLNTDEYVNRQEQKTYAPEFSADGSTPLYHVGWTYEIIVPGITNFSNTKQADMTRAYLPKDPRWSRVAVAPGETESRGTQLDKITVNKGLVNPPLIDEDGKATLTRIPNAT